MQRPLGGNARVEGQNGVGLRAFAAGEWTTVYPVDLVSRTTAYEAAVSLARDIFAGGEVTLQHTVAYETAISLAREIYSDVPHGARVANVVVETTTEPPNGVLYSSGLGRNTQ